MDKLCINWLKPAASQSLITGQYRMNHCADIWRHGLQLGLGLLLAVLSAPTAAQLVPLTPEEMQCGPMIRPDAVAPMDYRTDRKLLVVVEWGHFRPQVENLIKPMFEHFGSDLSYTLHAYPNHPRALLTLIRLGEREKSDQPKGLPYSIDCFFRRGITFRSDDLLVRMIYAQYLIKNGRSSEAMAQLDYVASVAKDNPLTHYNAGLLYFDAKMFDKALVQAHRAAQMGFDRPDLKDKLIQAGKWQDAAPPTQAAAAAASSTGPAVAASPAPAASAP